MSEYTPTTDEAFNATIYTWVDWKGTFASEEEAADAWTRMLAEVERAAAEKAWTRFVDVLSAHHEDMAPGVVADMERRNPYSKTKEEHDDQS